MSTRPPPLDADTASVGLIIFVGCLWAVVAVISGGAILVAVLL